MENEFFSKTRFSARLRALRGGRSQSEVAKILGLSQQKWQRIESGKNEPNLTLLVKMSVLLGTPVATLLGLDDTQIESLPPTKRMEGQLLKLERGAEEILADAKSYCDNVKSARKQFEKLKAEMT